MGKEIDKKEKSSPTEEQQKILESEVKNLVISASAGSGKTYILIEKLKSLICEKKVKVERLLVLTFTKVAAEEIKSRLTNAILSMKPTKQMLESLDSLPLSDISTIDSFCEKIIKRNINRLNLDENFTILDEKNSYRLKSLAFSSTFSHFAQTESEKFDEIYLAFKKNKKSIEECVYFLQDFFSAINDESEKLDIFENQISLLNQKAEKRICDYFNDCFVNAKDALNKVCQADLTNSQKNFVSSLEEILSVPIEGSLFDLCQKFNFYSLPVLRGRQSSDVKIPLDEAKSYVKLVFEIAKKYSFIPNGTKERNDEGRLVKAILSFYKHYINEYTMLKSKRSGLDFADIEKYAKKLLENEEVKKGLQDKYDYIFIDEYQDTNRLQESILKPIAEGGYFTAVGDIKQGIYGFRNASMEIMQDDIKNFSSCEDGDALYLNGNFRTDNDILSFVNQVFERVMTKDIVGIDYKEKSMLKGLKTFLKSSMPAVCVDVILKGDIEKRLELEEEACEKSDNDVYSVMKDTLESDHSEDEEINAILSKIELAITSQIYDSKRAEFRQVEYNDIALLFRGRSSLMRELVNRLRKMGVPVSADLKEELIEDNQIALINSLLKLTLNLFDDISLASVLCSPFGNFSIDELAQLRYEGGKDDQFCNVILNSGHKKVEQFKIMIEEFKFDIQVFGVIKALCRLFNKIDYYEYLASFNNSREKLSNINSLFKQIRSANLDFNVAGIINMLESSSQIKGGEGGGNSITITTIHSTKGLEYPIVILCEAGESLSKTYNKSYIISNDYGLGCYLGDFDSMTRVPSPTFLAGKLDLEKREFIDEIMIFYVALTRAQNHLFIIGSGREKDYSFNNLKAQNSYLKFIFYALGENFTSQLFSQGKIHTENYQFNIIEQVSQKEIEREISQTIEYQMPQEQQKALEDFSQFNYAFQKECKLSYKNSVTGAMKIGETESLAIFDENNLDEDVERVRSREEAIRTGNAYHEALKLLDFEKINSLKDLQDQSQFLIENMTDDYFNYIDYELLFKNIKVIKDVIGGNRVIKEREFIMQCKLNEIGLGESENLIIVQGIVDLFAVGDKTILIDYKYTSCNNSMTLKNRYTKQIELYSLSINKAFSKGPDEKYLLSLKDAKLIKFD